MYVVDLLYLYFKLGEGEGHSGHSISTLATAAGGGGSSGVCTSLLPEHVYHNLLENGRYSRNSNSANISSNSSSGHHSGVGGDDVGMYQGSSYQNNNHNGSVMAARARATKAALHQHLNLQSPNPYPSHHIKDEGWHNI